MYSSAAGICHQRPERSFTTGGVRWPVCGRCAGLYLGGALGALSVLVTRSRLARASRMPWRGLLVAAAAPTILSWLVEVVGGPPTPLAWRAALAVPAGAAAGALLATLARRVEAGLESVRQTT